jgi:23S rRNA (cytosine1962-C5)-methyltransferase
MIDATVKLKPAKDGPARAGHPWIFSGAIAEIDGEARSGAFVRVLSATNQVLGTGTYNPRGSIAVRLLARDETTLDASFVRRRIADAYALRETLGITRDATAYRLVHGEGDWLPGVIADVYGDFVVIQILTAGAERLRPAILAALQEVIDPKGVFERSAGGARREEGLGDRTDVAAGEAPPEQIEVNEGGARFLVDVRGGQKTGFYVDQRENRALVGRLARDRDVLNCFAYTGGFAIAAARGGARRVVSVETSGPALQVARQNWALNGLDESRAEWLARDVFDVLTPLADTTDDKRFDIVVLDPPPFARHRADRDKAVRAYRDVNRRALRALRPGGLLATFTCSAHVSGELFLHAVATAAQPGMRLQVLAHLGAPADHPVLAAHPEGAYLNGLLIRVAAG